MSTNISLITRKATVVRPGVIVSTVTDMHGSETVAFYDRSVATDGEIHIARSHGTVGEANTRHDAMVSLA